MPQSFNNDIETYRIETELGRDDLTISYRAGRKSDNYPVTIKVVAPQFVFDSYFVLRFKDAATRNIELDHPNIVKTYEVGERGGEILYVVTELLEAVSLADYLKTQGTLPVTEVIAITRQIASALDYAHSKGVYHGDLSDANIFIKDGHIQILDFGFTRAVEGTTLAKKGFAVGNPVYLSPERIRGESASRTGDLYAMGVLCYQMLTGKPPVSGDTTSVMHAQVYEQPVAPHLLNAAVRPGVSNVVLRMLSKGVELRHNTGAEFVGALQVAAEGSAPISPMIRTDNTSKMEPVKRPPAKPAPSTASRNWALWIFLLTPILGAALAFGFWAINQAGAVLSAGETSASVAVIPTVVPTFKVDSLPTPLPPTPTVSPPTATAMPSPTSLALQPGRIFVAEGSPFSNLVLAHNITSDYRPERPDNVFPPTEDPIYLFFDYTAMPPNARWGLEWKWDDQVLEESQEVWPTDYGDVGSAWVYFSPPFGFKPGPHTVSIKLDGEVVATAEFAVATE